MSILFRNRFVCVGVFRPGKHTPKGPNVRYQCHRCHFSCNDQKSLKPHWVRKHAPPEARDAARRFRCTQCDARFFRPDRLRQHSSVHSSEGDNKKTKATTVVAARARARDLKCPHCGFRTHRKDSLYTHVKTIHDPNSKPHACRFPKCVYRSRELALLLRHERCHKSPNSKYYNKPKTEEWTAPNSVVKPSLRSGDFYLCSFPKCTYKSKKWDNVNQHERRHKDPSSQIYGKPTTRRVKR